MRPVAPQPQRGGNQPLASPRRRGLASAVRCAGNDTACWNEGRFCHRMLGWPMIPTAWRVMTRIPVAG